MTEPTDRQQDILDYIREFWVANRFAPTAAEIALRFRFSSRTAAVNHLEALVKKGRITRRPGHGRTIELV